MAWRRPWSADTWRDEIRRADRAWFVADRDGTVVGYAGVALLADEAHVLMVAVRSGARRGGIGRALLGALLAEADARGARAVLLEVRDHDRAARALYGAAGFREVGRRPRYYADGSDAVVLRRPADRGPQADHPPTLQGGT